MSITTPDLSGQLAAGVYNELLNIVKREMSMYTSPARTCNWRFQPPQRSPRAEAALRSYWGDLFKDELTALETEWAEPRAATPITADTSNPPEASDVSIHKAS